jgi:multiple sugar transport system permease protein
LISIIWTVNYFPLIHIMTGGGPAYSTDILVTWAYREFFSFLEFNKGSAIAVLLFLITFSLSCLYARVIFAKS